MRHGFQKTPCPLHSVLFYFDLLAALSTMVLMHDPHNKLSGPSIMVDDSIVVVMVIELGEGSQDAI